MLGKHGPSVVVRRRTSWLRTTLLIAGVPIGVFALYVVYELGRYNAGYDRQAVAQQRTELEVQIEHLEKANREQRTRLAELDTIRVGRGRAHARSRDADRGPTARAALQLPLPGELRPGAHRAAELQARTAQRRGELGPP